MEKIKTSIREYWNWRSKSFGHDSDKSPAIANTWESVLRELVAETAGKRALDVGTGTGQLAMYLARNGFDVTGIDISEQMIARARQYAVESGLNIDFRIGDAEYPDFANDQFDVVVCRNLLWTLPRPENAIREWQRVIKPGGRLVISDGFWMNTTWSRIHKLAFKTLNGLFCKNGLIPLRFFCSYATVWKMLPYYEGLRVTDATRLLKKARFKDIGYYDTSCFDTYPYRANRSKAASSPFFIAYAHKAFA